MESSSLIALPRLLLLLMLAGALAGCAHAPLPGASDVAHATEAEPKAADEVAVLLAQPYIDPLTRYIGQHAGDRSRAAEVETLRVERERRCEAIAALYAKREASTASLERLRRGYRYSCPGVVEAFAERVAGAMTAEPPEPPADSLLAPAPAADSIQEATPVPTEAPTAGRPAIARKLLDDCYLLFRIHNYAEAGKACRRPAELGDARSQYILAVTLRVFENYPEALEWTRRAASQGLAEGQHHLGLLLYRGQGVGREEAAALRWFEQAGRQGLADAQYDAGKMYYRGEGTARDHLAARQWLMLAARQGHAGAQTLLGILHARGEGGPADGDAATQWLQRAAAQGVGEAQYQLGTLYAEGKLVNQDDAQAYVWLSLAAAGGERRALAPRDAAAARLDPERLAEARQRVRLALEKRR